MAKQPKKAESPTTKNAPSPTPTQEPKEAAPKLKTFRDEQLEASGILEETQRSVRRLFKTVRKGNDLPSEMVEEEIDRYQPGTWEHGQLTEGNDMVIHYLGLDRRPIFFSEEKWKKHNGYWRIRWRRPESHPDGDGKPTRYYSPFKGGNHPYLPEHTIRAYETKAQHEILIVTEGEKKADRVSQEGQLVIGISGIHNFTNQGDFLPKEFSDVIETCGVRRVVFLFDGDLFNISSNSKRQAEKRVKNFYYAARNFRDHFRRLTLAGIDTELYIAWVRQDQKDDPKGIDDLLVTQESRARKLMFDELKNQLIDKDGRSLYLESRRITTLSDPALLSVFHLESATSFVNHYRDQLQEHYPGGFFFGKEEYILFDDPTDDGKTFGLMNPLRAEERFIEQSDRDNGRINFLALVTFLSNRGFARRRVEGETYEQLIYIKDNRVEDVDERQIRDYVVDFVKAMEDKKQIEIVFRNGQCLSASKTFCYLPVIDLKFNPATRDCQHLYFEDAIWKVTAKGVEVMDYRKLSGYVWKHHIKPTTPKYVDGMFKLVRGKDGNYRIELGEKAFKSEWFLFLFNTCRHNWEKYIEEKVEDGRVVRTKVAARYLPEFKQQDLHDLLVKICAFGYLLHRYRDPSQTKAVVAMDATLVQVDQANGRSGKSIMGVALQKMLDTVMISGKKGDLEHDPFLLQQVTTQTQLIAFDDLRRNFSMETIYTMLSNRIQVNRKGKPLFDIPLENTPKIFLTTNYAISGDSGSSLDRQYLLAFSNYYSLRYKPSLEFGHNLFDDWEPGGEQWDMFYTFMAFAVHVYLHLYENTGTGFVKNDTTHLEVRRLRQEIGEDFLDWADSYFSPGGDGINREIERKAAFTSMAESSPNLKGLSAHKFGERIRNYCRFRGLGFNLPDGQPIKKGGKEYFSITDSLHPNGLTQNPGSAA